MSEQVLNIKFVQEVEKHPCLYNYELGDYSRKNVTEAAWNEIGKVMNMTGAAYKEKWKNLRAVFVRNMKPPTSGSRMKKKYYLMDFMQFTLPYVKTSNSKASGNLKDNSDAQENEEVPDSVPTDDLSLDETEDVTTQPVAEAGPLQKVNPSSSILGVKRKRQPLNEVDKFFVKFFKDRQEARESDKNPRKLFLLSLLDEVDKMSDEQMRFFKRKVLNLIDDIMCPNPTYEPLQFNLRPSPADSYSTSGTSTSNLTPINYSECLEGQATIHQFIDG